MEKQEKHEVVNQEVETMETAQETELAETENAEENNIQYHSLDEDDPKMQDMNTVDPGEEYTTFGAGERIVTTSPEQDPLFDEPDQQDINAATDPEDGPALDDTGDFTPVEDPDANPEPAATPSAPGVNRKPGIRKLMQQSMGPQNASDEAWQIIFAAKDNNNPLVDFPATGIEEILGEKCLIIYIPDPLTGIKGILPERHAGLYGREQLETLMNYPFLRVLPTDHHDQANNIVFLRRDTAQTVRAAWAWRQIEKDDVVEGVVTGVSRSPNGNAYRIHLDIEGIYSMLPISEVSHNYVEDVDYKRGDILNVKVLSKDEITSTDPVTHETKTNRSLLVSLRALTPDPWQLEHCIPIAKMPYFGTVVNIVRTGMFIRLTSGIEVKTPHPSLNYKGKTSVGDKIRVYPVVVDRDKRRAYGVLTESELNRTVRMYEARRRRKDRQSSGGIGIN